ncbi:MAG: DUF1007 family protein [Pseudomonadota bacterium]
MNRFTSLFAACVVATASVNLTVSQADAHPHVFVEANIEIVRNNKGEFVELRQVWRFDELFSSTIVIDYDDNTDGELDEKELKNVTTIVKESIAEYDFYTAMRVGGKALEFYEPEEIGAYFEDGKMIMFLSLEPAKPYDLSKAPLKVSASDTSYYVAFEFDNESVFVSGNSKGCSSNVVHPDYDSLYADNALTLSESFFNQDGGPGFGDEFYSWATISCS